MDPPEPMPALSASAVVRSLSPDSVDALVDTLVSDVAGGLTSVELRDLRGALDRGAGSAVSGARALMVAVAVAPPAGVIPPGVDPFAAGRAGLEAVSRALEPVTAPVGLRSMTESRVDPRRLWGDDLAGLRDLKRQWDPSDLSHANHSVLDG